MLQSAFYAKGKKVVNTVPSADTALHWGVQWTSHKASWQYHLWLVPSFFQTLRPASCGNSFNRRPTIQPLQLCLQQTKLMHEGWCAGIS